MLLCVVLLRSLGVIEDLASPRDCLQLKWPVWPVYRTETYA